MSDSEQQAEEKPFCVDRAKQGRAGCKKCKQKCATGELRIAKVVPSPFGEGKMKNWHHVNCMFEQFLKQRATTRRIESPDDLDGWDALSEDDKKVIIDKVKECAKELEQKHGTKISTNNWDTKKKERLKPSPSPKNSSLQKTSKSDVHKDLLFREFRRLVADISNVSSYLDKTELVRKMFTKGSDGVSFKGDLKLWCKLLLPGVFQRIYNLQNKQLIKLFSRMFNTNQSEMLEHLEQGDIAETIQHFFELSKRIKPTSKSTLTIGEVDEFLEELSQLTKEDEQIEHFEKIAPKCTANDLKIIIRLIRHDLRMNAGAKHILQGVHPDAYEVYQSSRDLDTVISRCQGSGSKETSVKASITLMTPVLPMLAEACKSVDQAMARCPKGMYSEIKYDGERVQVHKQGNEFRYFSRSLKPVLPHKIAHFKNYIPKAFPHGKDLILDSEILMVDTTNGKPLPFGTLGVHKKNEFKDASVCLFVFDCIYFNGEILTDKPIKERKKILKENMVEIPNHIVFSEMEEIHDTDDLISMIARVLKLGLEGLVLKPLDSIYEPGKRHWLKVKKDYLFEGAMADSADLIVLGAWYGTGKKGGMMSVFLMGCRDPDSGKFCTVTKVHTGHDDKTLERLQTELDMEKISYDQSKVPKWLKCTKTMIPDFVAKDPKNQPVWEITGAEFTQHEVHTADGISIRFPRVTKIRDDKTWETATNLYELKKLYEESKEHTDVSLLMKLKNETNNGKEKKSPSKASASSSSTSISSNNQPPKQTSLLDFCKTPQKRQRSPSRSSTPKKKAKTTNHIEFDPVKVIKNPLPDYFGNVKLLLEDGVSEKYSNFLRHFVAFGGTILNSDESDMATHVLHLNDVAEKQMDSPKSAKHVRIGWIKDTIAKQQLQDPHRYFVSLKGDDFSDS